MEIEKLRSFIEVYNCRNISRAAENLYISQSALSRRIQSLESELKAELFTRDGSILKPTACANALYKEAGKLIRQHDDTLLKMNRIKNGMGGVLRIGMLYTLPLGPTIRAISRMQETYSDVEMSFDCDKNTNIPYRLTERQLDVGITVYGEISGIDGINYEELGKNTLAVLVGKNHRLWKKRPLHAEDLNGEVLFSLMGVAEQSFVSVEQYLKNRRIKLAAQIPCRSAEEILMSVSTGKGVSYSAVISSELFGAFRDVVDLVPLDDTSLKQGYIVAAYDRENDMAGKFVQLLKQCW